MNVKSKLTTFKSPLAIAILVLLSLNIFQFYIVQSQKQQAKTEFFVQSKLNRDETYNKIIPTYKMIIDDKNTSPETKKVMEGKLTNLLNNSDIEVKLETLLKGKGFKDSFVQLYDNRASVFIKCSSKKISPDNLKIIQDYIFQATKIKDVEIIPK